MTARPDTPHPELVQLRAGHFHERPDYGVYRRRGTRDTLLIYTRSGGGRFGHARGELVTRAGELVLLAPGTFHDYAVAPGAAHWELLWAHFHAKADWQQLLALPEVSPGVHHLALGDPELTRRIEARLLDMVRLGNGPLRQGESLAMNALEEVLLWCDALNPNAGREPIDPRIRRALDVICGDLKTTHTLPALAKRAALSRSRFAHLFSTQVGTSPQRYQETQRLLRARELLELTARSIEQIADDLGFASPFYFSQRFKRAIGQSPSEYRAKRRLSNVNR